ncbi:MAG: hypothetical protein JM58_08160 [Peptococcaceae bacterium BICA1-8]|nr:MAG: hypothetical protein JM58_08160 [Peptococcaceae bacterium BICA1-8]
MFSVGVVGPKDTVEIIMEVAAEFKEHGKQFSTTALVYENEDETLDLLAKFDNTVDVYLFTGQVPFFIAKNHGALKKPAVFIPRTGTGLYRTLLDISYHYGLALNKLSFDTFNQATVFETFTELRLPREEIYVKELSENSQVKDLVDFHADLWKKQKICAAVTCLYSVYEKLNLMGIRVFRIVPTKSLIRENLNYAINEGRTQILKATQIAVVLIKINNFGNLFKDFYSGYKMAQLKLKIHQLMVEYSEKTQGSFYYPGGDEIFVFSTRGVIEDQTENYSKSSLLNDMRDELPELNIGIGIGFGKTANEAEANARIALQQAKDAGGNSAFIIMDDGKSVGPIGNGETLEFEWRTDDENLNMASQKTGIKTSTLTKINSALTHLKRNTITAQELSHYLKMTPRSARRILNTLEEHGQATKVGEENRSQKGRPSSLYRIYLSDLNL